MQTWPIGVFTSVDAGLGVRLDVGSKNWECPLVQIHAPHKQTRTAKVADEFLKKCQSADITVTGVFGGFDGESWRRHSHDGPHAVGTGCQRKRAVSAAGRG